MVFEAGSAPSADRNYVFNDDINAVRQVTRMGLGRERPLWQGSDGSGEAPVLTGMSLSQSSPIWALEVATGRPTSSVLAAIQ